MLADNALLIPPPGSTTPPVTAVIDAGVDPVVAKKR